ncbi:MAG: NAD-dependent epimerase/dehydratase family protein [Candidatus Daviesbacteria bacterium]|nr:NAD-dependent epimerase/dehydratase family protein [Candidatus Daviesbacteria bacterium]
MKAFVTGATGFIGSNLINRLIKDGWDIKILVRPKSINKILNNPKLKVIQGDITNLDDVKRGMQGTEIVFNVAGGLPNHKLSDQGYLDINVTGVKNILESCNEFKIKRLIHVSTVGIYGSGKNIITETSPLRLVDQYAKTKSKAEELIRTYREKFNLPVVIIRPTIGFGPRDTRPGFIDLFRLVNKGLYFPIGNGENYFHVFYIENLIDALMLAATKKEAIGEDFIIGDYPVPKMKDVIKNIYQVEGKKFPKIYIPFYLAFLAAHFFDIAQKIGLPAPLTSKRLTFITEDRRYDISKATKVLGYKSKVSLSEGVKRTYEWYKQNGYLS